MNEVEVTERFRLVQHEVTLTGEALETLKRDHRAAIDALRLDLEVLRRCLRQLHPEFATHFEATRAKLMREIDPAAL
jgi:hypothetical protein